MPDNRTDPDTIDFGDLVTQMTEIVHDHVAWLSESKDDEAAPAIELREADDAGLVERTAHAAVAGMAAAVLARNIGRVVSVAYPVSASFDGKRCWSISVDNDELHADEVIA